MSITRKKLIDFLAKYLKTNEYDDYCPNGLQVEGKNIINNICFAVSASQESIEKAIKLKADALITHHGIIWKQGGGKTITGAFKNRIAPLIKSNTNLFGYHLPLDGHPQIGNAAIIAQKLGLKNLKPFCEYKGAPVGIKGTFTTPLIPSSIKTKLKKILSHEIIISTPAKDHKIKSIGIVTGGAGSFHHHALDNNLDAFLTGEISENDWHEARESGISMFAGGHNATEEFGILALMNLINKEFKTKCQFIKSDNPI